MYLVLEILSNLSIFQSLLVRDTGSGPGLAKMPRTLDSLVVVGGRQEKTGLSAKRWLKVWESEAGEAFCALDPHRAG